MRKPDYKFLFVLAIFLFVQVIACVLALSWWSISQAQAFELIKPSGESYCSGGIVDGIPLTAGHCILEQPTVPDTVTVRLPSGTTFEAIVVHAVTNDSLNLDYAVLNSQDFNYVPTYHSTDVEPYPGEDAFYTGNPNGLGLFTYRGYYLGRVDVGIKDLEGFGNTLAFDIQVSNGASGSIFLNSNGNAVAILAMRTITYADPFYLTVVPPVDVSFGQDIQTQINDYILWLETSP